MATEQLVSASAAQLIGLGASDFSVSYTTVPVSTTTASPVSPSVVPSPGDDGSSEETLILAVVLPIVAVMIIAAVVYYCVVVRSGASGRSHSFAFGAQKEEIKFDEYMAIIDGPAESLNLEERML